MNQSRQRDRLQFDEPPISCAAQLAAYQAGLAQLDALISNKERDLLTFQGDAAALEGVRFVLRRLYILHQASVDAIAAYEKQNTMP